jgi:hypothetical protein
MYIATISPGGKPLPLIVRGVPADPELTLKVSCAAGIGEAAVAGAAMVIDTPSNDDAWAAAPTSNQAAAVHANASKAQRRRCITIKKRWKPLLLISHGCGRSAEVFDRVQALKRQVVLEHFVYQLIE